MNTILKKRIEAAAERYSVSWRKNPDGSESKEMFPVAAERSFKAGATFALQNQWISVEEALPEKNGQCGSIEVFVMCIDGSVGIDYYDYSRKNWRNNNCVTNWMYIPELKGGEK